MFNLSSFESSQGAESGLLGTAINHIRYWLTKLVHSPETGVVKLTVDPGSADVLFGEVVGLTSGVSECSLASGRGPFAVAISLSRTTLEDGDQGYFRMTGVAEVKLVTGLDLHNGQALYLSTTDGMATNVLPPLPCRKIGEVIDTANYTLAGGYLAKTMLEFDDIPAAP